MRPNHQLHLISPATLEAKHLWSSRAMDNPQAQLSDHGVEEAKNLHEYLIAQLGATSIPSDIFVASSVASIRTAHHAITPNESAGVNLLFDSRLNNIQDGETISDVADRMLDFANTARSQESAITLAVAHPTAIRAMLTRVCRFSESVAMGWAPISPGSDTTVTLKRGKWHVQPGHLGVKPSAKV